MSTVELRQVADQLSAGDQSFLHAYLGLKQRLLNPDFVAEISRRNREMDAGDYLTSAQVRELNQELEDKGL
jgi:hypothetical protein